MRAASTRHGKMKVSVTGILVLAGVFLYHGMRSLQGVSYSAEERERKAPAADVEAAETDTSCDWEAGGPELFVIRHNKNHPEGECGRADNRTPVAKLLRQTQP